jgi:hypothetical protein
MKKINLRAVLMTGLVVVSFVSFAYVNTDVYCKMLTSSGFSLPSAEQLPDEKTQLPDVELGKQILLVVKKMLSVYF